MIQLGEALFVQERRQSLVCAVRSKEAWSCGHCTRASGARMGTRSTSTAHAHHWYVTCLCSGRGVSNVPEDLEWVIIMCRKLLAVLHRITVCRFGEQPSSSEWYTALDCSPPTTPPPKHTRQGLHCSSPTSPIYDSPPPRQANRFTAARECSLPLTTFDSMDDLTEWGRTLYCTADWMPNAKEPNGVINALAGGYLQP